MIQVEVTQAVPANLTIPEPPLVIPHLLCVHFLLRLVQPHHVAPLAKGLRHAVERNATFRAAWRVVGPLAVEGDVPPVDMWQRLRTEVWSESAPKLPPNVTKADPTFRCTLFFS